MSSLLLPSQAETWGLDTTSQRLREATVAGDEAPGPETVTESFVELPDLEKGEEKEVRPKNDWASPGGTHTARLPPIVQFNSNNL